ncbi:type 1 glutamine amidotransferase family protein [Nocardiopsis aegyptia]|uniref:Putative intracellular protease/amidase n=1 Tax=Nocardiopsis aegyptia TaxID=220378 RepID=A0A7Z0JCL7_9ACTN|nr:type 1 glutamine amidotransferase family protein [Nocardiopsis aegyptia]NYJ36604.1 putative intracellular protease/amidase [Nocardiopsis aegyptia]
MNTESATTVHLAVYDDLADWEIGHAVSQIRSGDWQRQPGRYDVVTVGLTGAPVTTMGGLTVLPDITLTDLKPTASAMLILPGATGWDTEPESLAPFASAAGIFLDAGVPVAAICGATAGLAREGLLDHRDHTSAVPEYLQATGYAGADRYRHDLAVTDGDLITANPTAPVEFARQIFLRLDLHQPRIVDAWHRLFAQHDASAYMVLQEEA